MQLTVRSGAGPWDDPLTAKDGQIFIRYTVFAAVTGLVTTILSVWYIPGWIGATVGVAQGLVWCSVMLLRRRSSWLVNVTVLGVVAGFVELIADAWLVHGTQTLVYPQSGPFLFASPAYMPLAWFGMLSACVAFGITLRKRFSLVFSSIAAALAFGVYVPTYEALAAYAGWWHYRHVEWSLGPVPGYIVLGEVLMAVPIVFLTERLMHARTLTAMAYGMGLGWWIFASYALAWFVTT